MSDIIKNQKSVKAAKTELTSEEKKRKEAILAQYSAVDGEYPLCDMRMSILVQNSAVNGEYPVAVVNNSLMVYILCDRTRITVIK